MGLNTVSCFMLDPFEKKNRKKLGLLFYCSVSDEMSAGVGGFDLMTKLSKIVNDNMMMMNGEWKRKKHDDDK